jgi:energy-coupling factor transporter ATP-binding protein EcfA2
VLRNICYEILYPDTPQPKGYNPEEKWDHLCKHIKTMFGAELLKPEFIKATGLIQLEYSEHRIRYDISAAGRGFQQILLLLAYMYANPNTILLLDEPEAHLEVIRQREAFQLVNRVAEEMGSQVIIASHSEVVLDEAAEASKVVALIENNVFELNSAETQQRLRYIKKALTEIGWEKYYLARSKGHVLYLEGSTDLQMLLEFANKLNHKAAQLLRLANVQYTADNVPNTAINNFAALKEIFPKLKGLALFDHIPNLQQNPKLKIICWQRRELENYFARPAVLYKHAKLLGFKYSQTGSSKLEQTMKEVVADITPPIHLKKLSSDWWNTEKLSDNWLDIIFPDFFSRLDVYNDFSKRNYYTLIKLMPVEEISPEITEKLDAIYKLLLPV